MAITRDEPRIKVAGLVNWSDLVDSVEAAAGHLILSGDLYEDAYRLARVARFLRRRLKEVKIDEH